MASAPRSLTVALTLSMFVCGALSKPSVPFQPGVLRLVRDGRTTCDSNGESGVCYNALNCLRVAGVFGNNCPGSEGVCCLFYRQCGQRTSQEVSYFRSADEETGSECNYQVVKRSSNHCGMRVKLEQLEFPGDCQTRINIEGTFKGNNIGKLQFLERRSVPESQSVEDICSTETGNEYSFDTKNVDEVRLNVESSGGNIGKWKIRVTQVQCNDANTHDNHIPAVWPPPIITHPTSHTSATHPTSSVGPTATHPTSSVGPTTVAPCWWNCDTKPKPLPSKPKPTPIITTQEPDQEWARCGVKGPNKEKFSVRANDNNISGGETKPFIDMGQNSTWGKPPLNDSIHVEDFNIMGQNSTWGKPPLNDSIHVEVLRQLCMEDPLLCAGWKGRITYGKEAGKREYPWQVAMKVRGRFHCGASIIGDQHILTAAHCVTKYKNSPTSLYLSLGDYDLSSTSEQRNYVPTVERVTVHPAYSRTTLRNDLAVLKLTKKIKFSSTIRPVCLAPAGFDPTSKIAIVTGWGRDEHNQLQSKLKELASEVNRNGYCAGQWESNGAPRGFITKDMMCMSPIGGDSCNGDSGGPSVMDIGGTHYQIGIVSFGSGSCVDESLPGVYTRVTSYRDWIMQQMN